jgi:hypothetical protein
MPKNKKSNKKEVNKKSVKKNSKKENSLKDSKENSKEKKISEKKISKKENTRENKILKYTLIISGLIILFVIGFAFYIDSLKSFDYHGVEFEAVSFGDLLLYQTSFPVIYQGEQVPYNVYLRTKPSKLERIDFPREDFDAMKYTVLNIEDEINCDGDEVIAIANLRQVHDAIGMQIMTDKNASCDEQGRYAYLNIISSDKTQISKIGPNCYNLEFADCEILPVTEKYIAELLVNVF